MKKSDEKCRFAGRVAALGVASAASVLSIAMASCVGDSPDVPTATPAADASTDSSQPQGDANPSDAPSTPDTSVPTTYLDITDASNWSSYDLTAADAFGASAKAFGGGIFAGKYIYLSPAYGGNGVAFRFDTTEPFKTKSSWTTYDLTTAIDPGAHYANGVFDGTNLYFVPYDTGKMTRYDTTKSFVDDTAWSTYSLTSLYAGTFTGMGFDGQNLYAGGYGFPTSVVRYDTKGAGFEDSGAWSAYDLSTVDASANVTYPGTPAFDKRYLYFSSVNDGNITRFDTQSSFTATSSWEVFDGTSVAAAVSTGLGIGAVFDGKYVYFPPYSNNITTASTTLRYDTTKPFAQATSWEAFVLTKVDAAAINLHGGTFDGRYVYYPSFNETGIIVRYDTTAAFGDATSWQAFHIGAATSNIAEYSGIVFDGEYIYLVPQNKAGAAADLTIVRFHAKTPASLPAFTSSFQ